MLLSDRKHSKWTFAVDVPSVNNRRKTMRRGGYPTKATAQRALSDVLARYRVGVKVDDRQTVADYLTAWLNGKRHAFKPKTLHRYSEIVTKELIPALGALTVGEHFGEPIVHSGWSRGRDHSVRDGMPEAPHCGNGAWLRAHSSRRRAVLKTSPYGPNGH